MAKQHRIVYVESVGPDVHYSAHCVWPCGWTSGRYPLIHKWKIEDEWRKHLSDVEIIKAHLSRGREPSLRSQRDYYQARADEDKDPHTKQQWQTLADELSHRLNDGGSEGHEMLFEM